MEGMRAASGSVWLVILQFQLMLFVWIIFDFWRWGFAIQQAPDYVLRITVYKVRCLQGTGGLQNARLHPTHNQQM